MFFHKLFMKIAKWYVLCCRNIWEISFLTFWHENAANPIIRERGRLKLNNFAISNIIDKSVPSYKYIGFWFCVTLIQRLHWGIKLVHAATLVRKRRVPSFSCVSVPIHVSLYIQTSTFPYSLKNHTKAYLCKVLGNLPSSLQQI